MRISREYREILQENSNLISYFWGHRFNDYYAEIRFRAQIISLALKAYYMEHGELPETLDVLEGVYLKKLPTVPVSGEQFDYVPHPDASDESAVKHFYEDTMSIERRNLPYLRAPALNKNPTNSSYYPVDYIPSKIVEHLMFVKEK